ITGFVLVLVPERLPIDETARAAERLADAGIDVGAVVVNRVLPTDASGDFVEARRRQERVHLLEIERRFAPYAMVRVPQQPTDVHGVASLEAVAAALPGGQPTAPAPPPTPRGKNAALGWGPPRRRGGGAAGRGGGEPGGRGGGGGRWPPGGGGAAAPGPATLVGVVTMPAMSGRPARPWRIRCRP